MALLLTMLVLAACSRITGPRSFAMSAASVDGSTWSVNLSDTSGAISDMTVDPSPLFADQTGLPFVVAGAPNKLVVPWVGGSCDRQTTFAVTSDGNRMKIAYRIESAPGVCDDLGVMHQLILTMSPAIDPAFVTLTRQT